MAQVPSEIQDIYPKDGSPVSDALVKSRPCDNTLLEDTGLMAKVEETAFQLLCQQSLITHPCCALRVNDPQEDSDFFSLTFPKKLWKIVESNKFKSVCWDEEGTSIVINVELFKKEVLERKPPFRIFETSSMKSLVRQLNLYGFSKVQQNCQRSASLDDFMAEEKEGSAKVTKFKFYRNPNFIRGHPHLLLRMKRRVGVKNASRATASLVPEFNSTLRTQSNIYKHNCGLVDEAREQSLLSTSANLNVPQMNKAPTGQGMTCTNYPMGSDFCPPSSYLVRPSEQMPTVQYSISSHFSTFYMHTHCSYSQANGNNLNFISTSSPEFQIVSPLHNTHFGLPMEHPNCLTDHLNFSANQSCYYNLLPTRHPWLPTSNVTNISTDSQSTSTYLPSSILQCNPKDK